MEKVQTYLDNKTFDFLQKESDDNGETLSRLIGRVLYNYSEQNGDIMQNFRKKVIRNLLNLRLLNNALLSCVFDKEAISQERSSTHVLKVCRLVNEEIEKISI